MTKNLEAADEYDKNSDLECIPFENNFSDDEVPLNMPYVLKMKKLNSGLEKTNVSIKNTWCIRKPTFKK